MDARLVLPKDTVLDGSYRIERVIGSGGFGITYESEDIHLGTKVAVKEYYPEEFGQRDASLRVGPTTEKQKVTFEWGRTSFLLEARTLARFRHPSVVQVTRVFEANSTAYMVMIFELGQTLDTWLKGLGRTPTQEELDRIVWPLLGALEMMHAENFLHRDIAPDNIIVRTDGTPVLLDFGSARRAIAERSRALTGIVKAGYSPHEQYSADGRLQGPWSDIYALGGTLYRAVTGYPPEEATLRVDEDHVQPAAIAAKGTYRPAFLAAIDACLKLRSSARPQSVAQLRPMLMPAAARLTAVIPPPMTAAIPTRYPQRRAWWAAVAALMLIAGGVGGLTFTLWRAEERTREQANAAADARRKTDEEAAARETARSTAAAEEARTRQQAAQKQREAEARQKDAAPSHPPQKTHVPELGFSVQASSNSAWPVVVADVDKDSEADQKGLKAEDAIMTIDGRAVNEPHDVVKAVNETTNLTKQGRKVVLLYIFNLSANEKRFVALPLKVPEPPADQCGAGLPEGSPFHNFFCDPRVSELGLSVQSRSDHNGPVTITKIDQGSDAEQKGLKVGDEIISIASRDVKDALDVMKAIDEVTKKGGKAIMLYINSGGKGRYIAVKLKP